MPLVSAIPAVSESGTQLLSSTPGGRSASDWAADPATIKHAVATSIHCDRVIFMASPHERTASLALDRVLLDGFKRRPGVNPPVYYAASNLWNRPCPLISTRIDAP